MDGDEAKPAEEQPIWNNMLLDDEVTAAQSHDVGSSYGENLAHNGGGFNYEPNQFIDFGDDLVTSRGISDFGDLSSFGKRSTSTEMAKY